MRTIKFRAWNKSTNQMMDAITIQELACRPQLNEANVSNLIFEQFTGLTDKNGVEVYEGDLLNEVESKFEVIYNVDWAKFELKSIGHIQYPSWNRGAKMEVIGNIHEQ